MKESASYEESNEIEDFSSCSFGDEAEEMKEIASWGSCEEAEKKNESNELPEGTTNSWKTLYNV